MTFWASLPLSLPRSSVVGSAPLTGCSSCSVENGCQAGPEWLSHKQHLAPLLGFKARCWCADANISQGVCPGWNCSRARIPPQSHMSQSSSCHLPANEDRKDLWSEHWSMLHYMGEANQLKYVDHKDLAGCLGSNFTSVSASQAIAGSCFDPDVQIFYSFSCQWDWHTEDIAQAFVHPS